MYEESSREKRPLVYSGFLERARSFGVCVEEKDVAAFEPVVWRRVSS
jgi:hypothetical protein